MPGNDFVDLLPLEGGGEPSISSFSVSETQNMAPMSSILQDVNSFDVSGKIRAFSLLQESTVPVVAQKNYRMRGYYVAGSTYEFWTSSNPYSETPPSGHTLTNVVMETVLE